MNTVISPDGPTIAYDKLGHGPAVILVAGPLVHGPSGPDQSLPNSLRPALLSKTVPSVAAARVAIPSPRPSRVRSRIWNHSSTKPTGRPSCMAFPPELPWPCKRPYSSARKSRSWPCTSRLSIVGAIRLSSTRHCVHSIRECMNGREENALGGRAAIRACCHRQPQLRKKRDFLPSMFPLVYRQHSPLHSEQGRRKKTCPRPDRRLGHDRGTDRNRRASNHRSPLARIPLEKLFLSGGDLLDYEKYAATSSHRDDPFAAALDHPRLVSMSGHFQAVPDPRWKIPPLEWGTVVYRVEQGEPLRLVAHDYGVSYEAVRRVLRAARRR